MGDIQEMMSNLALQTKHEIEQMRILQTEKLALLRRKKQLLEEIGLEESVITPDDEKLYRQMFPLLIEIHRLQLKKSEIHHQLHLLDIHREVHDIYSTLVIVSQSEEKGVLSLWFQQLKELFQSLRGEQTVCVSHEPSYLTTRDGDQLTERLDVRLNYCGLSMHLNISNTHHETLQNDRGEQCRSVSVKTDYHVTGLQETVQDLLTHNASVSELLDFVKTVLDTDVIPFV